MLHQLFSLLLILASAFADADPLLYEVVQSAPVIQSAPVSQATASQAYAYPLQATDPDGDALTYRVVAGPAGLAVDATGRVTWASPAEGAWSVTLRVDDGRAYVDQSYLVAPAKPSNPAQAKEFR